LTTKRPAAPTVKSSSSGDSENVILKGFEVQVGQDGTKDNVKAKICSDDQKVCCETLQLSKPRGNNWVRNGNESWTGSALGLCNDKTFSTKARTTITNLLETKLLLTLNKAGRDNLKLENFNIDTVTSGGQKRRFKCGKVNVLDTNKGTATCYAQYPKNFGPTTTKRTTTSRPPFRSSSG